MKKILLMCLLALQSSVFSNAVSSDVMAAAPSIEGFLTIPFGASLTAVKQGVSDLGFTDIVVEQKDGFSILQAFANNDSSASRWGDSSLVFVVNQATNKLGLVIQRYDDLLTDRVVIKDLTKQFGLPMDEKATALIYEQIKKDLPEGLQRLTVWADHEVEGVAVSRFIRVLYFGDHVSIEYLDSGVL